MDIFNATRDGLETIRLWQKHLEIIACALDSNSKMIGEGQLRRARKALMDLALLMLDDKDTGSVFSHRNRSFGRKGKDHHRGPSGHSRSLSWSVSHTWSASKQLQSFANNLLSPRANEVTATNGLAMLVFSMSFIVIRIMDESKKRDRRNSSGLLKEIYEIEKCVHQMTDLVDAAQFPLSDELKEELRENVEELSLVCQAFKTGLDPLERKLRDTFRKVMSCRTEGLDLLGKATEP
ncbi:hypothetical protein Sango_0514400 [Sesamum angolense]|uniref:Uncharacterized protein n=1 Tax=Sesamum angolense TaxID=2727404 RepID=A0AAE2C103_9LAMI|nr:hypothetical protein Sango_0514400 [Sesamum angolense]